MSTEEAASSQQGNGGSIEEGATPLELFFDLVFVFAFTQVTSFLSDHLTWVGVLQGVALLAALWWAWVCYSWLTNAVPAEDVIPARLNILCAMAAMLVVSLAAPDAFGESGVLFGLAYFVVRLLHVALYALATGDTPETRRAVLGLAPGFLGGPALLVAAGFLDGLAQGTLWALALAIDYGVPLFRGVWGFHVRAGHFVERHGLIIIIALGESIVAIGAAGLKLDPGVVLAAFFAIVLSAALWWAYFDYVVLAAERRLTSAQEHERPLRATPTVTCTCCRWSPASSSSPWGSRRSSPKSATRSGRSPRSRSAAALYLLGHNAFRLRDVGSISVPRLVVAASSCALIPLAMSAPALLTLAILAVVLAAFETVRSREFRRKLRAR